MCIKIDLRSVKDYQVDLKVLLSRIATGKAILFAGAGFSKGTKNVRGLEPPLASQLSRDICKLGDFTEDDDLRYSADYYLANCDRDKLIQLLKVTYTLNEISDDHINICKLPWRRFYTTNYDMCIEIASRRAGKVTECISIDYPINEYYKRGGLCVHLNGATDSLTQDTLDTSFKLSASSYISAESFTNSDWSYCFKKDLERSSAIVFVGYSMYDIEVQKILHENDSLRDKTYFITCESPKPKTTYVLSKYGGVIPIGVKGFAELIVDNSGLLEVTTSTHNMQSLCLYELKSNPGPIRDADVEAMLLYGDIGDEHIDNGVSSEQRFPYLILRDELPRIAEFVKNGDNVVVYGGLGNGKSILLRELRTFLSINSIEVYDIYDLEGDYIGDIDLLSKTTQRIAIIADGYERYMDLLTHYSKTLPTNVSIIASARTPEHDRLRPELRSIGFEYKEVDIDVLSDDEASGFVKIIDNIGMWGSDAGLSHQGKINTLRKKDAMQISLSLLHLLSAPQIKDKIKTVLSNLLQTPPTKDTIFAIALIEVLDLTANSSLVSEVAGNEQIYKSSVLNNESFRHLFKVCGNRVLGKSRLFCLSLIRDHLSASYVTRQLLKIAKNLNTHTTRDYAQNRVFKATLRFSAVEQLISDQNKKANLKWYYEDLKVEVPWLTNDPHYWLQYGMANIAFNDYQKAQQFIDQAYAIAQKKAGYYTSNIDTQQARLFILVAMKQNNSASIYDGFEKAHNLLSRLEDDVYKFRQVQTYGKFYDVCYKKLSKKNRQKFKDACKRMLADMKRAEANNDICVDQKVFKKAREKLLYISETVA